MELRHAMFCDFARVTENEKVDVFGIFRLWNAERVPVTAPLLCVYALFEGEEFQSLRVRSRTSHVTFQIRASDSTIMFEFDGEATVPEAADTSTPTVLTLILQCQNVPFTKYGMHTSTFVIDDVEMPGPSLFVRESPPKHG